jgi:catechol 2,3-dioxygenase-like lactoylglutathione lyase family enzyme
MPVANLKMITLDSADAVRDAEFWSQVLGWEVAYSEGDYAMLAGPGHALGFGRLPDYQPPAWPNEHGSKQFHLDLAVDDLEAAAKACTELGASRPTDQPSQEWIVLLDPSGHPFCLTQASNW